MAEQTTFDSILYQEDDTYKLRLEGFDGPMELLLLLIRKHKYDIYDIPIAKILKDYLAVIEAMEELDLDLAGEFLVMASTLAQIKSRMLLPKPSEEEGEDGEDPRAELVRRLLEYERFREAAKGLEERPWLGRDVFARDKEDSADQVEKTEAPIEADLFHLLVAFKEVLKEASEEFVHEVSRKRMTTQEAVLEILEHFQGLEPGSSLGFRDLFPKGASKGKVVGLFMGILELLRNGAIKIRQNVAFGDIRITSTSEEE